MPRTKEVKRSENTPALDETNTSALYRMKSVTVSALTDRAKQLITDHDALVLDEVANKNEEAA